MKRRCQKNDRIVNTFLTTVPKQQAPNSKAINKKNREVMEKRKRFFKERKLRKN